MIRVLLVDDHAVFRDGLRELLNHIPDLEVVGEAGTGQQALEEMGKQPDVVLLDIGLPGMDGIRVCRSIVEQYPNTRVVMLTMHDDPQLLLEALRAGACSYVLKAADAQSVVSAVRAAAKGQASLDPASTSRLLEEYRRLSQERAGFSKASLTERERVLLALIAEGATNREIAAHLALSEQTVKNNLSVLYQKMGVNNRAEAVMAAVQGDIPLPKVRWKKRTK
ncbi:MAG: response regulator transcription factor [Chloroflexi bacterium]|nr:response regulator transcription factor [Chloroflexota bacterium]